MQAIAGAILILAGSVLVASGIIVHGTRSPGPPAMAGYFLGAFLSTIGLAVLLALPLKRLLKRLWDAIPVDDPKPKGRE